MSEGRTQKKIVVYTTMSCAYCLRAKAMLKSKGWSYDEVSVEDDDAKRAWLVEVTGRRTVPQIFIGDRPIGGYDDMAALDRRGQLEPMVFG